MTRWLACLAAALTVHGCGASDFHCQSDDQCEGGTCLLDGFCGFPDDRCPSGLRYGELSGPLAGQCVPAMETDGGSTTDASTSAETTPTMSATGPDPVTSTSEPDSSSSTDPVVTSELTTTDPGSSTGEPPMDPSLVLWLDFEGNENAWLRDRSSFGNHGTCAMKGCPAQDEGVFGSGAFFNGAAAVVVEHHESLTTPKGFTLSLWHRLFEAPVLHRAILTKAIDGVSNSWEMYYFPTSCADCPTVGMAAEEGDMIVRAPASSPIDAWIHLAATWNGAELVLWVDGEVVMSSQSPVLLMLDEPVIVGGDDDDLPSGYDALFMGTIDEVRIYDRALEPDEIVALAASP